jgi:hypothetical protein
MGMEDCLLKLHTVELHPRVLAQVKALAQAMHCNRDFLINAMLECAFEQGAQDRCTAITQKSPAWWDGFALTKSLGDTYCWIERPHEEPLGDSMTIRQLIAIVETMNPDADVFIALFNANGTSETFDIEDVTENNGHAQIEIYAEEPAA